MGCIFSQPKVSDASPLQGQQSQGRQNDKNLSQQLLANQIPPSHQQSENKLLKEQNGLQVNYESQNQFNKSSQATQQAQNLNQKEMKVDKKEDHQELSQIKQQPKEQNSQIIQIQQATQPKKSGDPPHNDKQATNQKITIQTESLLENFETEQKFLKEKQVKDQKKISQDEQLEELSSHNSELVKSIVNDSQFQEKKQEQHQHQHVQEQKSQFKQQEQHEDQHQQEQKLQLNQQEKEQQQHQHLHEQKSQLKQQQLEEVEEEEQKQSKSELKKSLSGEHKNEQKEGKDNEKQSILFKSQIQQQNEIHLDKQRVQEQESSFIIDDESQLDQTREEQLLNVSKVRLRIEREQEELKLSQLERENLLQLEEPTAFDQSQLNSIANDLHQSISWKIQQYNNSSQEQKPDQQHSLICGVNAQFEPNEQGENIPVDLVLLVDNACSMAGDKSKELRKCLKKIFKVMNKNDRVCLIKFSESATVLTPFLRVEQESNFPKFQQKVKDLYGESSTNIETGIEAALWMINKRKYKNPNVGIFLITDGIDDDLKLDVRIQKLVLQQNINYQFRINTFAFGSDHEFKSLQNIATQTNGQYYNVNNIKDLSKSLVIGYSELASTLAYDLKIIIDPIQKDMKITSNSPHQVINKDNNILMANIYPYLLCQDKRIFTFQIESSSPFTSKIGKVYVSYKKWNGEKVKQRLQIQESQKNENENSLNISYIRRYSGNQLHIALQSIKERKDFSSAETSLTNLSHFITQNFQKQINEQQIKQLQTDINELKSKCNAQDFNEEQFYILSNVHLSQVGISQQHLSDFTSLQASKLKQLESLPLKAMKK